MRKEYDFTNGVLGKYYRRLPHSIFKSGELNPQAKINDADVQFIRDNYFPFKCTAPMLARRFGISAPHVRKIIKGIRWANGEVRTQKFRLLKAKDVLAIRALYQKNLFGYRKLARKFGVSIGVIRPIIQGKTYKAVRA